MRCRLATLVLATVVLAPAVAADRDQAMAPATAERKAAEDSLLFSREVQELLEAARRARGAASAVPAAAGAPPARPEPGALHLSAIVYQGPNDWQIWLNGRRFDPGAGAGPIEIRGVQPDLVRLRWRGGTGRAAEITLRPNQTYIVGSGEIVEGPPERAAMRSR